MRRVALAAAAVVGGGAATARGGTLAQVPSFGDNPGALAMWRYRPAGLPAHPALVVAMHGCTQDHAAAAATGWNELADAHGFVVVYPEQSTANNPLRCFNWAGEYGDPANLERGEGENRSIEQMVRRAIADDDVDPARVFVVGFSAGGAMVPVMLATWPDLFAGGAVESGVPYRCGTTVNAALACQAMGSHPELVRSAHAWGDLVRAADPGYAGPWPRVAIFHGAADTTVSPDNLRELVKQWTDVHGADAAADQRTAIGDTTRERYRAGGEVVVETYRVAGMGHAVSMGEDPVMPCALAPGAYLEDHALCAAARAADFFGLADLGDEDPPPGDDVPGDDAPGDAAPSDPIACGCAVRGGDDGAGVLLLAALALGGATRRRCPGAGHLAPCLPLR